MFASDGLEQNRKGNVPPRWPDPGSIAFHHPSRTGWAGPGCIGGLDPAAGRGYPPAGRAAGTAGAHCGLLR